MSTLPFKVAPPDKSGEPLKHIRNHAALALARLPAQFRGKKNIEKLVRVIANRFQGLEDMLWDVYLSRTLKGAFGASLDNLGKIVGQKREGRSDAVYRIWISVRILLNRSCGTGDDILRIYSLLVDKTRIQLREEFPASFTLYVSGVLPEGLSERDGLALVKLAKAAGVRVVFQDDNAELSSMLVLTDATGDGSGLEDDGPGLDDADGTIPEAGLLSSAVA